MTDQPLARGPLARRAIGRFVAGIGVLGLLLFAAAGTLDFWQAWLFLALLLGCVLTIGVLLLVYDPALLERRMRAREREQTQVVVMLLGVPGYLLAFVLPGLDRRFGWSDVPVPVVLGADALFFAAYVLFAIVLQVNRYASRVVEVQDGQSLVSSGPYAHVRHPMYSAVLLMFIAAPMALGSWWAMVATALILAILVVRILNEEAVLSRDLPGYRAYMEATRFRLVPGVW